MTNIDSVSTTFMNFDASYNTLLLVYNQLVTDLRSNVDPNYTSLTGYSLIDPSNTLISGFPTTNTDMTTCFNTCHANNICKGATYDNSNTCYQYSSINNVSPATNINSTILNTNLLQIIQVLNAQLLTLISDMLQFINNNSNKELYNNQLKTTILTNTNLNQQYDLLKQDRKNIEELMYSNLDRQLIDTNLEITKYYYLYLFLIILVIITFFILVKILLTPKSVDNVNNNAFEIASFVIISFLIIFIVYLRNVTIK